MKFFEDTIYIGEIVLQVKIGQKAYERLQCYEDTIDVWASIQSILISAANISKILWPNKKFNDRGERLRKMLSISDDNILRDRTFRNHFEHYDERIEKWFEKGANGVFIDLAMNPDLCFSTQNTKRGYNTIDETVVFSGEKFDLKKLNTAMLELLEKCKPYTFV
jgi:hypothetical protein